MSAIQQIEEKLIDWFEGNIAEMLFIFNSQSYDKALDQVIKGPVAELTRGKPELVGRLSSIAKDWLHVLYIQKVGWGYEPS